MRGMDTGKFYSRWSERVGSGRVSRGSTRSRAGHQNCQWLLAHTWYVSQVHWFFNSFLNLITDIAAPQILISAPLLATSSTIWCFPRFFPTSAPESCWNCNRAPSKCSKLHCEFVRIRRKRVEWKVASFSGVDMWPSGPVAPTHVLISDCTNFL